MRDACSLIYRSHPMFEEPSSGIILPSCRSTALPVWATSAASLSEREDERASFLKPRLHKLSRIQN